MLLIISLFSGCGLQEKERGLKRKEAELNQKEQQLNLREKNLKFKEEELAQQETRLDTLSKDSSLVLNPNLVGTWLTKMTCTETTCPGSAVGDTKTEQWVLSYVGNHIIAEALANSKLVRIYTGSFNGNSIELVQDNQANTSEPSTQMTANLTIKDANTLEGERKIVRNNNCKIVYALEMQKQ